MLTFKKPKKRKTFAVPALSSRAVEDIVDSVMKDGGSPVSALNKVKKAKIFIAAKLNGVSTQEAKDLAGYKGSAKQLLASPVGQTVLEQLLQVKFSDSVIVDRLKEMWDATESWTTESGKVIGTKPDRDMQKYAMDRVLNLRKYTNTGKNQDADGNSNGTPSEIVFHVLPVPVGPKIKDEENVVNVKAEVVK